MSPPAYLARILRARPTRTTLIRVRPYCWREVAAGDPCMACDVRLAAVPKRGRLDDEVRRSPLPAADRSPALEVMRVRDRKAHRLTSVVTHLRFILASQSEPGSHAHCLRGICGHMRRRVHVRGPHRRACRSLLRRQALHRSKRETCTEARSRTLGGAHHWLTCIARGTAAHGQWADSPPTCNSCTRVSARGRGY
jgi:hypothetical protein